MPSLRWVRAVPLVVSVALVGALVGYARWRTIAPEPAPPIEARLELAAGDVRVDGVPAASGVALRGGASVATGIGARALVRLPDGALAFVRGGSALVVGDDTVALEHGEYFVDAPASERRALVHRSGRTEVTAAGAGFVVERDADRERVYVAHGAAVVAAAGGRAELRAGERATVVGDAAPVVEPVAYWEDWTGGMADRGAGSGSAAPGSGEIYGVDDGAAEGSPAARLEVRSQHVRAIVRDGVSITEVEQTFFNPAPRPVEGWYWITAPAGAVVSGFAVERGGHLIEGNVIERVEAAERYQAAKGAGEEPALLEQVDDHTYRARIYPVPATGTRRVVVRWARLEDLGTGKLVFVHPMASGAPPRIGDLSITVDLGDEGRRMQLATLADARIEDGGRRVTMRRSGYTPRVDFQLEGVLEPPPETVRVLRFAPGHDQPDYVLARYAPAVDWGRAASGPADVVVAVDVSSGADDATRRLAADFAGAVLRALGEGDRFALVGVDVAVRAVHPADGLAPATADEVQKAIAALAALEPGGATDLGAAFDAALARLGQSRRPAIVYVGDGVATSGELAGSELAGHLERMLAGTPARFFAVATGPGADAPLLDELARSGGGKGLRLEDGDAIVGRALELAAALRAPAVTDFELDLGAGLDDAVKAPGRKLAPGEEAVVLARTFHDLPTRAIVRGRLGGEPFEREIPIEVLASDTARVVPRLWAAAQVTQLLARATAPEDVRSQIVTLGLEHGLVTPFTSLLTVLPPDLPEGSMGSNGPPTSRNRYGTGLGNDEGAWGDAAEFGMVGLLNAGSGEGGGGRGEGWGRDEAVVEDGPRIVRQSAAPARVCSALARRPLGQRAAIWERRLRNATTPPALLATRALAERACEIDDWRAERLFLSLLAARIDDEATAVAVLDAMMARRDVAVHLGRLVLRRRVDPRVALAVERRLFGEVDWDRADRELAAVPSVERRIDEVRALAARAPDSPAGEVRLAELLVEAGRADEAAAVVRRLRQKGLAGVEVVKRLGELQAGAGDRDAAVRTWSEMVELDRYDGDARRLFADLLLSQGWYELAYRQYQTAVALEPDDPLLRVRLAHAAAGAGRVDEALRLDRAVASAPGRPGPADPRRWARLWSAARLAAMVASPPDGVAPEAIARRVRELGVVPATGRLVLLVWSDLGSDIELGTRLGGRAAAVGESVDASAVGLAAVVLADTTADPEMIAYLRSAPRSVPLVLERRELGWDGDRLVARVDRRELPARKTKLPL